MGSKEFRNLSEQIEILRSKGLIVDDEAYAKEVLLRENYFFINGYRHLFMRSNQDKLYIQGTTFNELYSLFLFDRNIRNIIFRNVLVIENNVKSIFSYQLSKKYGYKEKDYLRNKNFNADPAKYRQINDLLSKMKRQIRINGKQHSATMHYLSNYGYIPLWVLVKVLSFGIIGELFSILKPEDQLSIAEYYNLDIENLANYLPILSNYRNLCAHEDIVYENKTQKYIKDTKYHTELKIPVMNDECIYGKNDVFSLIIIMKYMLKPNDFSKLIDDFIKEIELLDSNINVIPVEKILDRMGFPSNFAKLVEL
jgi:abortive infection bacteriophage resistance protein